jgi:hypothetical protein
MATTLPPPPIGADPTSWAQSDWYSKLVVYLTSTGAVPWALIDKSGSNLADIATRAHNTLQSMQGGTTNEFYHLTAAQYAVVGLGNHNDLLSKQGGTTNEYYHLTAAEYANLNTFISQAADPTTSNIAAGRYAMYKNTTSGLLKLWANDGGTLKSVTLT